MPTRTAAALTLMPTRIAATARTAVPPPFTSPLTPTSTGPFTSTLPSRPLAAIALLLTAAAAAGCASRQTAESQPHAEQAVLAAVIDTTDGRTRGEGLVVSSTTWAPGVAERAVMRDRAIAAPPFAEPLATRFAGATPEPAPLSLPADFRADVTVANDPHSAADAGADPETFWSRFHETHPGAAVWLRLTAPVFDDTSDTALIAADLRCGPRCGSGWLYQLRKDAAGRFHVTAELVLWIF